MLKSKDKHKWPDRGLEPVPECPACGSDNRNLLYENLTDNVFHCAPGTWTMKRCNQCECAYLDPRPTADTIHLAYETYYTHSADAEYHGDAPADLKRTLINGYRNHRFGSNLQPASSLGAALFYCLPNLRRRIDCSTRCLPRLRDGARLLDVGAGSGDYLRLAQSLGWQAVGVDSDPVVVKHATAIGLTVRQGGPEAFLDQPASFDAITLNHAIEHMHHPRQTLSYVFELLRPGGFVYMETPNIDALGHGNFREHWRGLEVPRHLTIFSWQSLEALLHQTGFDIEKRIIKSEEYAPLAAKSRALREEGDPYSCRPKLTDRLRGLLYSFYLQFNHAQSEVITVTARKPL